MKDNNFDGLHNVVSGQREGRLQNLQTDPSEGGFQSEKPGDYAGSVNNEPSVYSGRGKRNDSNLSANEGRDDVGHQDASTTSDRD